MKTVAVSGYFDPIHVGHIELIHFAKQLGDKLVVIVNNDHQASLKKGKPFMKEDERVKIVEALKDVDEVFLSIDQDPTVCKSLEAVNPDIFAQGGDRHQGEAPETPICHKLDIKTVDGLGKKIQSSSELVEESLKE